MILKSLISRFSVAHSGRNFGFKATNLHDLSAEHVSRVYCLPKKEVQSIFPRRLPKKFYQQVDAVGKACWVLRKQSYEILSELKDGDSQKRFLLYGEDGSGKTLCMSQIVTFCIKSGWMVIHVPSVFSWTQSWWNEVRPSNKHANSFDQPKEAAIWLELFRTINGQFCSQIKLTEDYTWTKKESSSAGEEIRKIIELGLLKPNLATDVVGVLLKEISRVENPKMLLAVDDFNACYNLTSFEHEKEKIDTQSLNLVRYFHELIETNKFPGSVLLALSRTRMQGQLVPSVSPAELLGPKGARATEGYKEVCIPYYEKEEMKELLDHYHQEKWLKKGMSPKDINQLWHLTAGNPRELGKLFSFM